MNLFLKPHGYLRRFTSAQILPVFHQSSFLTLWHLPLRHFATFTDFSTCFYESVYRHEIQIKLRFCKIPTSGQQMCLKILVFPDVMLRGGVN